jgi:hypothetical protein
MARGEGKSRNEGKEEKSGNMERLYRLGWKAEVIETSKERLKKMKNKN